MSPSSLVLLDCVTGGKFSNLGDVFCYTARMVRAKVKFPNYDTRNDQGGTLETLEDGRITVEIGDDDHGVKQVVTASYPNRSFQFPLE